jgi:methionyl-tRNA formyltransferase
VVVSYRKNRETKKKRPDVVAPLTELATEVICAPATNSPETIDALRRLNCDLLLLGQCGILRDDVLAIPRIGTLNAHPGILPYYRGLDSSKWAVLQNDWDKIGVTAHWVDEGVDTGPIVAKRTYRIRGSTNSDQLDAVLFEECADLLVQVVGRLLHGETLTPESVPHTESRQYFKMHSRLIGIVDRILSGIKFPT